MADGDKEVWLVVVEGELLVEPLESTVAVAGTSVAAIEEGLDVQALSASSAISARERNFVLNRFIIAPYV